jgi:iron(II)-dependent oxidoreductase
LNSNQTLSVQGYQLSTGKVIHLSKVIPLFSFDINDTTYYSLSVAFDKQANAFIFQLPRSIQGRLIVDKKFKTGWKALISFKNLSTDTLFLSNIIPFGKSTDRLYLTAAGPWSLARTKIFRPGLGPVGVVLPDNTWEAGYSEIRSEVGNHICAISRRTNLEGGEKRRWYSKLPPQARVEYTFYAEHFTGEWQNGLRLMFQKRYLYDLEKFDNRLYERQDLSWIRQCFIITTQMAWDHDFYDQQKGGYQFADYLQLGQELFGGWDAYILWPTWPTLGLDQRNQWDLYGDLPGGLAKLRELADFSRKQGTKFFISYNPWDQSTRQVDPYQGMAQLIQATDADGVILDTYGWSTQDLQAAADGIKSGVVMYSEGMAVPKDMPGIITGRVHDAIYMPPPLNLNKLIKPDNTIFRVGQLADGELHRETAVAFFNGYGVEMNVYRPGRPTWMEEEYLYLGKLVRILRENSSAFYCLDWTPLIPTLTDSIWVNQWPVSDKTIYTIFSLIPEGFVGPLFQGEVDSVSHWVSLYHHEEIPPDTVNGELYIPVKMDAFNQSWLNSRKEGNVDCIARLPRILEVSLEQDGLTFEASKGEQIKIWAGMPSYQSTPKLYSIKKQTIKLHEEFGRYEGKLVIQLFQGRELLDERVMNLPMQTPRLISKVLKTSTAVETPVEMIEIEGTEHYVFKNQDDQGIIPYLTFPKGKAVKIRSFFMDKYPVTNRQYKEFLDATHYLPDDTVNFLKHWEQGDYPVDQGNYPVVYVSWDDANAYAGWAGKRLPTEQEWQYAAQGSDTILWPWGNEFDSTRCNVGLDQPTAVDSFTTGSSPFGVMDLVGNVWQLTHDIYDNGAYYFIIIRGGSYYHPTSSWWYVKGGPQPLNKTQMMLRISPGFERNATVGFRCVKDRE